MKQYIKIENNKVVLFHEPLIVGDRAIFNPSEEQILAQGWVEYIPEEIPVEEYQPTYEEKVVDLIRQRYTIDDEFAILRQRDTKKAEFEEYFEFCEQCKLIAKNGQN